MLLRDKRGEGLFHRLREDTKKLGGFPKERIDLAPLIIEVGKVAGVDTVVRSSFVARIGSASSADLLRGEPIEGGAYLHGNIAISRCRVRVHPKVFAFLGYFVQLGLGVNGA